MARHCWKSGWHVKQGPHIHIMIKCQTSETVGVWILPCDVTFTPGGRTAEEVLLSRRRSPSGLLGLRFIRLPSPFVGEGAKKGKHYAR